MAFIWICTIAWSIKTAHKSWSGGTRCSQNTCPGNSFLFFKRWKHFLEHTHTHENNQINELFSPKKAHGEPYIKSKLPLCQHNFFSISVTIQRCIHWNTFYINLHMLLSLATLWLSTRKTFGDRNRGNKKIWIEPPHRMHMRNLIEHLQF